MRKCQEKQEKQVELLAVTQLENTFLVATGLACMKPPGLTLTNKPMTDRGQTPSQKPTKPAPARPPCLREQDGTFHPLSSGSGSHNWPDKTWIPLQTAVSKGNTGRDNVFFRTSHESNFNQGQETRQRCEKKHTGGK